MTAYGRIRGRIGCSELNKKGNNMIETIYGVLQVWPYGTASGLVKADPHASVVIVPVVPIPPQTITVARTSIIVGKRGKSA
jgi:hypothetical protein